MIWLTRTMLALLGISIIATAGALGFMATDRVPPLDYLYIEVLNPTVKRGEELRWEVSYVQTRRCEIVVERRAFDSLGKMHPIEGLEFPISGPIGQPVTSVRRVLIDESFPLGPGRVETDRIFRCNPLHWIFPVRGFTDAFEFEVVP